MKVSVTYLRGHMKEILRALERHEDVHILRRGKLKGIIKAMPGKPQIKVRDHPFFGMLASSGSVNRRMERLRGRRYRHL